MLKAYIVYTLAKLKKVLIILKATSATYVPFVPKFVTLILFKACLLFTFNNVVLNLEKARDFSLLLFAFSLLDMFFGLCTSANDLICYSLLNTFQSATAAQEHLRAMLQIAPGVIQETVTRQDVVDSVRYFHVAAKEWLDIMLECNNKANKNIELLLATSSQVQECLKTIQNVEFPLVQSELPPLSGSLVQAGVVQVPDQLAQELPPLSGSLVQAEVIQVPDQLAQLNVGKLSADLAKCREDLTAIKNSLSQLETEINDGMHIMVRGIRRMGR